MCEKRTNKKNMTDIAFYFISVKSTKWGRVKKKLERVNKKKIMTKTKAQTINNDRRSNPSHLIPHLLVYIVFDYTYDFHWAY